MVLFVSNFCAVGCSQFPNASALDHSWVSQDWLTDLGLPQYTSAFQTQLVDGRLLNVLTKKDLDKHLSVRQKFHQNSMLNGIQLLRMLSFSKRVS